MTGAAIVGVGLTPFTRASSRSVVGLAVDAVGDAVRDAALDLSAVDGVVTFGLAGDAAPPVAVATALAFGPLHLGIQLELGGQAPCLLLQQAAAAIDAGIAEVVVVYRAMNGRSGIQIGSTPFAGPASQHRYPIGYSAYGLYVAMWGQRYLYRTGQESNALGEVPMAQREWAALNDRAVRRTPLTREQYEAEPFVFEPFRRSDCTVEVDGACAVVVTSIERARDLPHRGVRIASAEYVAPRRSGLDIGDHLLADDISTNYTSHLANRLFGKAGLTPSDVQLAEIYDCFSSSVLMAIEGLGLAERGGATELIRSGATRPGGRLPLNTNGGLLSEGYLHGMNTVCEAVLQLQGRAGARQVPDCEVALVTSGALMDGSAALLIADGG